MAILRLAGPAVALLLDWYGSCRRAKQKCGRAGPRGGKVGDPGGRGPVGQGGGPQASSHHLLSRVPALSLHPCDFGVTIL
jgi:hypothetical protein